MTGGHRVSRAVTGPTRTRSPMGANDSNGTYSYVASAIR
jgi:hypothetical protein